MSTTTKSLTDSVVRKSPMVAVVLCWVAVLLDGFDMVVLGVVLPSMMEDPNLQLTAAEGTQISTAGLFGMMIGALAIGRITDVIGRRWVIIVSVFSFSVLTMFLGFVEQVWLLILLRFLAGLGLGGCMPTSISMVTEFRGRDKAGSSATLTTTGYHVGAVLTSLMGIVMLADFGWHSLFIAGAVVGIVVTPVMIWLLPESPQFLLAKGKTDEAYRLAAQYGIELDDAFDADSAAADGEGEPKSGFSALLDPRYRRNTIFIWLTSFMGLLLVYGLNTWLPGIMRAADYDMGNSLGFLLVLNVGAVVGLIIAGAISDKTNPRSTGILWFVLSGVFLALMSIKLPLVALYGVVFLTGVFVFSSQNLVYGFVGANHPSRLRATAMGGAAGVGRLGAISGPLIGGMLLSMGLAHPWGFYAYAAVGFAGAALFAVTRSMGRSQKMVESAAVAAASDHGTASEPRV